MEKTINQICRFCGKEIVEPNPQYHETLDYTDDVTRMEYYHDQCEALISDVSLDVPEGYIRYMCRLTSEKTVLIISDSLKVQIQRTDKMPLSLIRKASCRYYKNMLNIDVPVQLAHALVEVYYG
jgi:hypothetical protein